MYPPIQYSFVHDSVLELRLGLELHRTLVRANPIYGHPISKAHKSKDNQLASCIDENDDPF